ncbi:chromosome condensation protein CrcB [Latilactobacillus sakei]|nr:CrcB family protein [Latilactobacillus sakei]AUX11007.1 chromosome condensation protein CrcB [Latilactobacillus sakei]
MTILLVGFGAALGAILRYQLTRIGNHIASEFPLVTFLINLTGSFCLGWLTASQLSQPMTLFLGVGVLGGYTTFSTLNSELSQLWFRRRYHIFLGYWFLTYGLGLLVAAAGFYAGL